MHDANESKTVHRTHNHTPNRFAVIPTPDKLRADPRYTGLGIRIAFLEYLAPTDGRPFPRDSRSNDLWHWQTSFEAKEADALFRPTRPDYISSGTIIFASPVLGFRRASMVRDPDGHAVRLVER